MEPLESNDRETLQTGRAAQELLNNQTFIKFLDALKQAYKDQIFDSRPEDSQLREEIYLRAAVLDDLLHLLNISAARAISLAEALAEDAQYEDNH